MGGVESDGWHDDSGLDAVNERDDVHLLSLVQGLGLCSCLPPSHPLPLMWMVLFVMAGVGCGMETGYNLSDTV